MENLRGQLKYNQVQQRSVASENEAKSEEQPEEPYVREEKQLAGYKIKEPKR